MKYFLIFFLFAPLISLAQPSLEQVLDFSVEEQSIPDCLRQLSRSSGVEIAFSSQFFDVHSRRSISFQQAPLQEILAAILTDTEVDYQFSYGRILLSRSRAIRYTISGYLEDQESGERLFLAAVYIPDLELGTVTNEYGFYSLSLPAGQHLVKTQYLGFQEIEYLIDLQQDSWHNFKLNSSNFLSEVVVTPDSLVNPYFISSEEQDYQISPKLSQLMPTLGGDPDPLRTAQLLPGVAVVTDGQSGMQVRGSDNGHNLLLLDGAPVYIPYHLLGFHSAYNSSTIKSTQVLSGNFSARYGGALSSVVDVRTREGNRYQWSGEVGANLNNINALIEGPLIKEKSSLLLAGRVSHSNFLYQGALNDLVFFEAENPLKSNYYDFNAKWNYQFSRQDRLYLSFYQGQDVLVSAEAQDTEDFLVESSLELGWSNTIASLRWNHLFNDRLFANLNLTYSRHSFDNSALFELFEDDDEIQEEFYFFNIQSQNLDYGLRLDFDYAPSPAHRLRWGMGAFDRSFSPDISSIDQDSLDLSEVEFDEISDLDDFITTLEINAREWYLYAEDQWQLSPQTSLRLGLRASTFGEHFLDQLQFEPRLSFDYKIKPQLNWNIAGSRMVQQLHLIASSALQLPTDLWLPSVGELNPQTAWLFETGLRWSVDDHLRLGINAYFKDMQSLYSLPESISTLDLEADDLENILLQGSGQSKGLELLAEYHRLQYGFVGSYVLSETQREFPNYDFGFEQFERYPGDYDSRHQLKLFFYHHLNDQLHWSINWVYSSPTPQRFLQESELGGTLVNVRPDFNATRNSRRSAAYHRLDFGLDYRFTTSALEHQLHLGAYNIYGRNNIAFYQAFDFNQPETAEPIATLSFIPAFRYQLRF